MINNNKYNKNINKIYMNNPQRTTGVYKKFKTLTNQPNSISQWDSYSRTQQNQNSFRKKQEQDEDGHWIGSQSTPPRPDQLKSGFNNQSFETKQLPSNLTARSNISTDNQALKTPTQLIQGILKGLASGKLTTVNPYYSQESEQKLTEILTNQNKLQSFIAELETDMAEVDRDVVKNYEMLIILLRHIGKSDVEIKHSAKGLELNFNRNILIKQENEIEKLEKKVKEKDEHIKEIIQEYESVIRNFNDVIEKLLDQRGSPSRGHEGGHHSPHAHQRRNNRH